MKTLQTFSLQLFFLLSLVIVGCKDEISPEQSLAGEWALEDVYGTGGLTLIEPFFHQQDSLLYNYTFTGQNPDLTLSLENDPAAFNLTGTYEQAQLIDSMGAILNKIIVNTEFDHGDWYIDQDTLFLENVVSERKFLILERTESRLMVKGDFSFFNRQDFAPFVGLYSGTEYKTYKKVK